MFSTTLPHSCLIDLCRVLRHQLGAGLTLRDVFRKQSERGPRALRPVARDICTSLESGDALRVALEKQRSAFPPLFLSLAVVGEETGQLPEVFTELEKYFTLQQKLRRQLRSQSLLPIIQLVLAFFVIALLIFVLGAIGQSRGGQAPTILGHKGGAGSLVFLGLSFGSMFSLVALYVMLTRALQQKPAVDALLLRLPAIGPCLEALVLGRFAMSLHVTLDSGMPIVPAMRLSLEATGNAAYASRANVITKAIKNGEDLTLAMTRGRIFPEEFINMVLSGEEGGRVPEIMRHQAEYYFEEASRRLTTLTRLATLGVWLIYAVFMVIAIFKIATMYLGQLGA
ncbi:MAG: hypothetical protein FJ271_20515 [Planctomycetes bacterium]|nr:hypothetical protein [Planctomycetota bacterium]